MTDFKTILSARAELVEQALISLLEDKPCGHETERPRKLMEAMRHSSLDGGKRLRPFLMIEAARLFDIEPEECVVAACALELIHCYSLVHDDLPAMDDDELRRGRPTTHIAFGEDTAILAGDALLTLAFDVLSRETAHRDPAVRIELVRLFAGHAGLGGMVGGQMLDLEAEKQSNISEEQILTLQSMKTGALIRCACEAGGVLGGASAEQRKALLEFGALVGQAFQLADDILDETSDASTMGKQTGKDADRGKGTLISLLGLETARDRAGQLLQQAIDALAPFGNKADVLKETARFTVERKH
ncbi:MAG: polyprenyl synthetase family protein [Pseudomonadota bacterium]